MCGRFGLFVTPEVLEEYFALDDLVAAVEPHYNLTPGRAVAVVRDREGQRRLDALQWGLIPFWAKEAKIGNRMINARSETVATSGAFKHAFKKRRCIIPADGFYEWKKIEGQKRKQPYFIHRPDNEPFAFAGLWEVWRPDGSEDELVSCTILTGEPNDKMAEIHDRMPVMLPPDAWDKLHLQMIWFGRTWCPALRHDPTRCPICSWAMPKARQLAAATHRRPRRPTRSR